MALPPSIQPERITALLDKEIPPMNSYVEPAILPWGGQLVLGAHAKTGKSFVLLEMARALATGENLFDCPLFPVPRPVRVLYIENEIGEIGLKKRADKIFNDTERHKYGKRLDNLLYVCKIPELQIDNKAGRSLLYDLCNEVQPHVVILDPIGRMHGYDENVAKEMAQMFMHLDELQKLFAANNMALVFSQHYGKPKDPRWQVDGLNPYELRGSSKFYDCPDSLITMLRTHDLATKHEAWSLTMRFTLRHGEAPDDIILHVNEKNDGRVRYLKNKAGERVCLLKAPPAKPTATQLGFTVA